MLNMNVTLPTVPVTTDVDLGRVGLSAQTEFSLNSLLDGSRTVRSHKVAGDITISHQATNEFGGSVRHLVRRNKAKNGDKSPASAHLVITAPDNAAGAEAGITAVMELLAALLAFGGYPPIDGMTELVDSVVLSADGFVIHNDADVEVNIGPRLIPTLQRVLNSEG